MSFMDEILDDLDRDEAPLRKAQQQIGCALLTVLGIIVTVAVGLIVLATLYFTGNI